MSESHDEQSPLRAADARFVEHLAAHFASPPLSAARRAAFDDALAERIARPRRRRLLVPAFAAAAAAAAFAWYLVPGAVDPGATGSSGGDSLAAAAATARWELELLDPTALTELDDADDLERLPDDYVAIAGFFLDG